jgi:hypothetical protein
MKIQPSFMSSVKTTATPKKRGAKFRKACCWGCKTNKSYFFDLFIYKRGCKRIKSEFFACPSGPKKGGATNKIKDGTGYYN